MLVFLLHHPHSIRSTIFHSSISLSCVSPSLFPLLSSRSHQFRSLSLGEDHSDRGVVYQRGRERDRREVRKVEGEVGRSVTALLRCRSTPLRSIARHGIMIPREISGETSRNRLNSTFKIHGRTINLYFVCTRRTDSAARFTLRRAAEIGDPFLGLIPPSFLFNRFKPVPNGSMKRGGGIKMYYKFFSNGERCRRFAG